MTVKELIKLLSALPDDSMQVYMYSDLEGNSVAPVVPDIYSDSDSDGNELYVLSPMY